jgi:glycosyltransferase involved in cell wall biosynthesis
MIEKKLTNILLVTHFFPPKHNAGTENYTLGLGKALQAKGYSVQIVCAEDWDFGRDYWNNVSTEQFDGLTIHRHHINWLKASNPNRVLYDSPHVEKWFDNFLKFNHFDIAHTVHLSSLGVGVLRSIKRAKIPMVLTLMDFWFLCPSRLPLLRSNGDLCDGQTTGWECQSCMMADSRFFQKIDRFNIPESIESQVWEVISKVPILTRQKGIRGMLLDINHRKRVLIEALALPDIILTHSNTVKSLFAKSNIPVEVIHNGHDLSWLNIKHKSSAMDVMRFGYLGQITRIKGIHILVDAFIKSGFGAKAKLDIWGDFKKDPTNYPKELINLIGDCPSIKMLGRYERKNLASILSEIDVVVVPSLWYENAPLVIQEAFATNTPVIASNIGGMAEMIRHEENGLLFEVGNSNDLAKQLKRFVDEPILVDRLEQQIEPVRRFEDELMELEAVYRQLIEGSH